MKNIYMASRWSRQLSLRQIRDQLHEKTKLRVVSRWIDAERPRNPDEKFFISRHGRLRLQDDLTDLRKCDFVVADILEGMGRRGGMAIEIGYAIGLNKPVHLIGNPAEFGIFGNVFHETSADWEAFFRLYS